MILTSLSLANFRNLSTSRIEPHPRFNIFWGQNGSGKSNILESIYILGNVRSFRPGKNRDLIRLGEERSRIQACIERESISKQIQLEIEPKRKRFWVDEKLVASFSDFVGTLPVVVFSPEDLYLLRGASSERRRFLDRMVSAVKPAHLADLQQYNSILRERNRLLKETPSNSQLLTIYTDQIIPVGARLVSRRLNAIDHIRTVFRHVFAKIFSSDVRTDFNYRSNWMTAATSNEPKLEDIENSLRDALRKNGRSERQVGFTLVGPHRDDVSIEIDGQAAREYASQGQLRSLILALKITEVKYLANHNGCCPILLLDDVSSELDRRRNGQLFGFIRENEAQTFITTTDQSFIQIDRDYRAFSIYSGQIEQAGEA